MNINAQRRALRDACRKVDDYAQLPIHADYRYEDGRKLHLLGISKGGKPVGSDKDPARPWVAVFGEDGNDKKVLPADLHSCRYAAFLRKATKQEKAKLDRKQDTLPAVEMLRILEASASAVTLASTGVYKAYVPLI